MGVWAAFVLAALLARKTGQYKRAKTSIDHSTLDSPNKRASSLPAPTPQYPTWSISPGIPHSLENSPFPISIGPVGMAQRRGSHSRLQSNATANTTAHTHSYSKPRHHSSSHRGVLSLLRSLRDVNHPSSASPSPSSSESRPVLAPLQFNLRRLPSRLALAETVVMRVSSGSDHVKVGAKRKRAVSGNENTHNISRGSRNGLNAFKRRRPYLQPEESSDEGTGTSMEIDTRVRCPDSESSSDGDASDWDSCRYSLCL